MNNTQRLECDTVLWRNIWQQHLLHLVHFTLKDNVTKERHFHHYCLKSTKKAPATKGNGKSEFSSSCI